jgi:hypothetical protein
MLRFDRENRVGKQTTHVGARLTVARVTDNERRRNAGDVNRPVPAQIGGVARAAEPCPVRYRRR